MVRGIQRLLLLLSMPALVNAQAGNSFTQTNLVSDGSVKAQVTDKQLINPWGIAIGQQTPFWINTAGSGLSEVYDASGNKQFVVQVPPAKGSTNPGTPSGIVFNSSATDFIIPNSSSALFIFASLDGTISAWNAALTNAQLIVDNSAAGAVYTGLAIENNGIASYLLAANFAANSIDVLDTQFAKITLAGSFVDPQIPQGYAPFNVHVIDNQAFVMYALQTAGGGPATAGSGAGYVSVFDLNGNLLHHAIAGGNLNAPWGIALAPKSFAPFGGDLLIGNFGDGTINAYDPTNYGLVGQLQDASGKPIQNDRLWELVFGQNGTGDPNTLYFSAGVNDEKGGLFGSIVGGGTATVGDFSLKLAASTLMVARGASATLQLNVLPANGFNAPVTFSVSGLPTGATVQFAPVTVTPGAASGATTVLTVTAGTGSTTGPTGYSVSRMSGGLPLKVSAGVMLPLGLMAFLPGLRRRRKGIGISAMLIGAFSLGLLTLTMAGCGGSKARSGGTGTVSAGTSTVTVTATSGSLSHTTTFTLTVQ